MPDTTKPPVYLLTVTWGENGADNKKVVILNIAEGSPGAMMTPKRAFDLGTELIDAARSQGYDEKLPQVGNFAA